MKKNFASILRCIVLLLLCTANVHADGNAWPVDRGSAGAQGVSESKMPAELAELWKYEVEGGAFDATPIIASDRVFACDADGVVYCLKLSDGTLVWKVKTESGFLAAAAFKEDRLIVCDFDGFVRCLDATDGKELWKFETEAQIDAGANFYNDLVLVTSEDGSLYALELSNGMLKWKYETGDQLRCSPSIAGNLTFLGGCDGQLHVVNLDMGTALEQKMALQSPTGSTPAVLDELAIVPTHAGTVLAFNWQNGNELWRFKDIDVTQEIRSSPAIFGDRVYINPRNKRVLAFEKSSGKIAWEHVLRKRSDSSPVYADGRVWVTATDGSILALDAGTGEMRWSEQRTGSFLASPAIAKERLVVANDKGVVYCFGAK